VPQNKVPYDLTKLTQVFFEKTKPSSVHKKIVTKACTIFNASAALLLLQDKNTNRLAVVQTHNLPEQYLDIAKKDFTVARAAVKERKIRIVQDIRPSFRKSNKKTVELAKEHGITSLISAPLRGDGETLGCLNIYFKRRLKYSRMKETMELFANLCALALQHNRLHNCYDETMRVVNGLQNIGGLFSSPFNLNELIQVILRTATDFVNADSGSILWIDEAQKAILDAYEYDRRTRKMTQYQSSARLDQGFSGEILRSRRALAISDLNAYKDASPIAMKKKRISVLGIPMIIRDKVVGILFINSYSPRVFAEDEISHLTILSNQTAIALSNVSLANIVKRETKETALLYEVSQSLISTLDFDQLLKNILQHLKETFDFLNISVMLVDEEKQLLYTHASILPTQQEDNLRLRIGKDGITGHVAQNKAMYYSPDVREDTHYVMGHEKTRSEVCFPLLIGDRLIGVLDVESSQKDGFAQDTIRLLSSLSAQIAIAIDNARLYAETKKLSLTDPLTQLSNRRSFDIFIDAEIRRAERYRRTFVVMMIDFDNFKNYNDRYGHTAGDSVLRKLSRIMKSMIRDVDFLCRYGGDEFVSILPETDASFALDVAERMRRSISAQKIQPKVTLSIGIASFPHDARDKARLIDLADQACYEAKQRGGNRVLFTFKPKEDR
jgi:diguanylate cyclase (GGDEF)-like protein